MPRWINLDGTLHIVGSTETCSCERDHSPSSRCRRCGGLQHWQAIYGGIAEACPTCDAPDFEDGPLPRHDQGTILVRA